MSFLLGVDLGQTRDFTAIAVLEESSKRRYDVRHLERLRHRPYTEVVDRIGFLVRRLPSRPELAVDATGVGRPVVDMLTEARLPADLYPITITGGDTVARNGAERRVPKRDLASTVAVLLQSERLRIAPSLPEAKTLFDELIRFRVSISLDGHDAYAAWREADHDDLVLAVACAAWLAEHGRDPWPTFFREETRRLRSVLQGASP